ncbi:hypothetical protein CU633_21370 [Bacillus sp. V3-13]|uniref:hypothetical protein n=1 Tax=Bacillus sp. V3-13 TaxID=2053728 RepID=UPI000C7584CD|nr:hypothetical protein [Bacillus sp. V3-13]PLR75381.1 hypothetical protein CU633_21370 [Bacillus sp. V3-13]
MFVKVYQYHIETGKEQEFIEIQEKAAEIYRKYVDFHTAYLKSNDDPTKWMEISWYGSEKIYEKSISIINEQKEIQELYKRFQSVLASDKHEISEENFSQIKEI